jgi:hypothetical protein
MKNAQSNLQKVDIQYNAVKILYERRPSEASFPFYGLLKTKVNAQSVHPELQHGIL